MAARSWRSERFQSDHDTPLVRSWCGRSAGYEVSHLGLSARFAGIIRTPDVTTRPLLKPWITPPPPAHHPLHPWLVSAGSLTARITAHLGPMRVDVRFQGARRPARDEARLIGLSEKRLAHVREVVLSVDGRPLVFAHSIATPRDLRGAWRAVTRLGTRPLAAALFADRRGQREGGRFFLIGPPPFPYKKEAKHRLPPPPPFCGRGARLSCLADRVCGEPRC